MARKSPPTKSPRAKSPRPKSPAKPAAKPARKSRPQPAADAAITPATGFAARLGAAARTASMITPRPATQTEPIRLYYWPTPNGHKISIMLEECALPYAIDPVNIAAGEQFRPEFLVIAPNNRMPAIVDPQGPGGGPISVFESGAILQYLGRKTGRFYPAEERARVEVEQWLMWQMAGLGPMAGQAHHFRQYAPEAIPYAVDRYTNECNRLYGVMNARLADREFLAGAYSIADIACIGWVRLHKRQGQDLAGFVHLRRWFDTMMARPAVQRGIGVRVEAALHVDIKDPAVRAVLFDQRAR
jgi:GST-like protein